MADSEFGPEELDYLYEEGRRRLREVTETVGQQERKIFTILSIALIVTGGISIIGQLEFTNWNPASWNPTSIFSGLVIVSSVIVVAIGSIGLWPRSFEDGANISWLVQWNRGGASVQHMKVEVLEKTFVAGFEKNERVLKHKGRCLNWLVPAAIIQIACVVGLAVAQASSQSGM